MAAKKGNSKSKQVKGTVDQAQKRLKALGSITEEIKGRPLVSSGNTLLNLACSDTPHGAFSMGTIVNIVGDSNTGKTVLGISVMAEATLQERFRGHRLMMDDAEHALAMNLAAMFGSELAQRIERPSKITPTGHSETVEDWAVNVERLLDDGKPFIYLLDSMDSLTTFVELELRKKNRELLEKGESPKGDYIGAKKADLISQSLRNLESEIMRNNSLLLIISQTREAIGMSFKYKYRAGGNGLRFYSSHEVWLAHVEDIKRRERSIGSRSLIRGKKNKFTGKQRDVPLIVYDGYGIDDVQGMMEYLLTEKVFISGDPPDHKKAKPKKVTQTKETGPKRQSTLFHCPEFDLKEAVSREKFLLMMDDPGRYRALVEFVADHWKSVEDSLKITRRNRYQTASYVDEGREDIKTDAEASDNL